MNTAKKKNGKKVINEVQVIPAVEERQLPVVNTPDMLIKLGIEKGMPMDQLKELMSMQREWLWDKAKSHFLLAKSKFQGEVPIIKKSTNVKFALKDNKGTVDYNYAALGEIKEAIRPLLPKYGFSYDWKIIDFKDEKNEPKIKVICEVSHIGGFSKETEMEAYHDGSGGKSNIQARASTISYLERYTLKAAFGLVEEDEDDDGRKAQAPPANPNVKKQKPTEKAFGDLLKRAESGEEVLEKAIDSLILTDAQVEALRIIESKIKESKV